jgi:CO/xanthine dehydrogenase FAD-binding subunit
MNPFTWARPVDGASPQIRNQATTGGKVLQGDQGARALVRAAREVVVVDWPDGGRDGVTAADVAGVSPNPGYMLTAASSRSRP